MGQTLVLSEYVVYEQSADARGHSSPPVTSVRAAHRFHSLKVVEEALLAVLGAEARL
jgi:hypothetical protein